MESSPLSPRKTELAFNQLWDAIRTCELNVLYHRSKARSRLRQARALDLSSITLATVAGIGILSGIRGIPDQLWAVIAFLSGFVGQLRSILQLNDHMLEHHRLDNEFSSVLSVLNGIVSRCQDIDAITPELNAQLRLALERYRVTNERDHSDYKPQELATFEAQINARYPESRLWTPSTTVDLIEGHENDQRPESSTDDSVAAPGSAPQTG